MAETLTTINKAIYFRLGTGTTSVTYSWNNIVKPEVNRVQRAICRGKIKNLLDKTTIKAGDLSFMRKEVFFELVIPTTLSADITTASTSVGLTDSSSFSSSGKVIINHDIISYTTNTSNTLGTVTGIGRKHFDGDEVRQLYSLPNKFWKPIGLYYNDEPVDMKDPREGKHYSTTYWELVNFSSTVKYLDIVGYKGEKDVFELRYIEDATDMSDDSDTTNLPDDYGTRVIAPLVAGKLLLHTEQANRAKEYLQEGYAELSDMYKDFAETRREYRRVFRTSPMV